MGHPIYVCYQQTTTKPVSYTHLDVYKRQVYCHIYKKNCFPNILIFIKLLIGKHFNKNCDILRQEHIYGRTGLDSSPRKLKKVDEELF